MRIPTVSTLLLMVASAHGQESITYLSCLSVPSGGSQAVASDYWLAQGFRTGTNASPYALESVELLMADASGTPGSLTVSLYDANSDFFPAQCLWTLSGSLNPVAAGVYGYTASGVVLAPRSFYFVVASGSLPSSTGSYAWQYTKNMVNPPFQRIGGWAWGYTLSSADGLVWGRNAPPGLPKFAVTATPVPEPSDLALFGLCGLLALRKLKSQ